jgi:ABC-type multidrug transport system fused ATPase/permease subunit
MTSPSLIPRSPTVPAAKVESVACPNGATQVLTVVIFAAMLFYLDPFLALISLLVLPILFATLLMYAQRSRFASREVRVRLAELTSAAEESLSALGLVKSFMRFKHEEGRLRELDTLELRQQMAVVPQEISLFIWNSGVQSSLALMMILSGVAAYMQLWSRGSITQTLRSRQPAICHVFRVLCFLIVFLMVISQM